MSHRRCETLRVPIIITVAALSFTACAPTVRIIAPEKPIQINLNVRIDQEIRVRLDKDIEDLLADNPDLF